MRNEARAQLRGPRLPEPASLHELSESAPVPWAMGLGARGKAVDFQAWLRKAIAMETRTRRLARALGLWKHSSSPRISWGLSGAW